MVFGGIYYFQETKSEVLDEETDLFFDEEVGDTDSIIDKTASGYEEFTSNNASQPNSKTLDSIFSSFRKEYDSIHHNSLYFDKIKKPDNWESGAYLYIVRNNNDIELRIKLNLITKKKFELIGWKLISDEKELSIEPTNPIIDEKRKDKLRASCDMRVGGPLESFVLAIVSSRKNTMLFISEKDELKISIAESQKESIHRVYNAYNRGLESMLKSN